MGQRKSFLSQQRVGRTLIVGDERTQVNEVGCLMDDRESGDSCDVYEDIDLRTDSAIEFDQHIGAAGNNPSPRTVLAEEGQDLL